MAASSTSMNTSRKVDDRVRIILENAASRKHRAFLMLVGDRGRDQIVNLHAMVSKAMHKSKVSVLWCYKTEFSFGSASKAKRAAQFKKEVDRGISTVESNNAFEVFLAQTKIRFCYYKDTHKILGQTFGMCILQDFEALTPNLLARTMETVEGGGLIVLMIRTLRSLKQLYTIAMDVHSRYRRPQHGEIVPRFNERFLLSLADCQSFLCVNDKLEVLPFTSNVRTVQPLAQKDLFTEEEKKHRLLQEELKGNAIVGPLVQCSMTLDQSTAVLSMMEAIAEKSLSTTITLTAARGRGKSAALGLAVAGAVTQGYSNIFVTAPSPENVATLFEFAVKGLEEMGYKDHTDFQIIQAESADMGRAVIRINVFKGHRQTIQYLLPNDVTKFAQAELVVIDEAAAIPLPLVKSILGPYLVILSSTITGYEGTGRALSVKLFSDLRKQAKTGSADAKSRGLKELKMTQPIRYGSGDPIEQWLYKVLCLDADLAQQGSPPCVHPDKLDLYYVNRDTLFSYHPAAEELLQRIVALYVSSHYKNQPNDLQLLSDAPAHHLFVLLDSDSTAGSSVPAVYAVIQVCAEGNIKNDKLEADLGKGVRPSGDLIPYTLAQHFQEPAFGELSGLRVVRIAVLPDMARKGYGTRALQLLMEYYSGKITSLEEPSAPAVDSAEEEEDEEQGGKDTKVSLKPRKKLPHLLHRLCDRPPEQYHYLGVGYGLTTELFGFWGKGGFHPVYLRQATNDLTGEHTMIMLRGMGEGEGQGWVDKFSADFNKRFVRLLPLSFRSLPVVTALSVALHKCERLPPLDEQSLMSFLTPWDIRRLSAFSRHLVDRSVVLDLIPTIASLYFTGRFPRLSLPMAQAAVVLGVGLQGLTLEDIARQPEFASTPVSTLNTFFTKAMAKVNECVEGILAAEGNPEEDEEEKMKAKAAQVEGTISLKRRRKADDTEEGPPVVHKPLKKKPVKKKKGAA